MPLKTHKHRTHKRHAKHYAKVYWPYLPLVVILATGLFLGQSLAVRSQRGVLAYATHVSGKSLLDATNLQRTKYGQSTLSINEKLSKAAQTKANDMATRNYWSHNTPDGNAPWVFIDATGYNYEKAGENLAYGFVNSSETIAGWMNSPAHKENLLDPLYREVGFGIANVSNFQDAGPETVVVAMYGDPVGSPVPAEAPAAPAPPSTQAVSTSNKTAVEPATKSINKAQVLTGGSMPWITFGIGVLSGAAVIYLLVKHGLGLRRVIKGGEEFVLHHPVLDLTVVSFIALCALLTQSTGLIK